jgi:cysteine desulfurase
MENPIYLDYNATTPIDPEVATVMLPYLQTHFGNPSSSYPIGRYNKEVVERAREQVSSLIHSKHDEIYFTSCATESNNLALRGILLSNKERGNHIITSSIEHPAITEVCRYLSTLGFDITYLPVNSDGAVNPKDVETAIRKETILITIIHANNEVGTIQPIEKIGAIAKERNIIFHTDAAQSVGKIEVDVEKLGVDMLTIAGHKLYAPKGIGALYIKQGTKIENFMFGAGQESGIRPGTENVMHIVGLGKACEIAKRDFDKNSQHCGLMRDRLLNGIRDNLGDIVKVNGNLGNSLPNTLSISFDNVEAHTLASVISKDLFISTGSACHSGTTEISSVLKAMNIDFKTAASTVRISTGKRTSVQEIDFAIQILTEAVKKLS